MQFSILITLLLTFTVANAKPTPFPIDLNTISLPSLSSALRPKTCPPNGLLSANHLSPTLMVRVSSSFPSIAFGSTKTPLVTPKDFCTIFNLVIPPSAVGKTCTLKFLFPGYGQSSGGFAYSGGGHFTFTGYAFGAGATEKTTYVFLSIYLSILRATLLACTFPFPSFGCRY